MVYVQIRASARVESVDNPLMDFFHKKFRSEHFLFFRTLLVVVDRIDENILIALHKRWDVLSSDSRHKDIFLVLLDMLAIALVVSSSCILVNLFYTQVHLPARPLGFVLDKFVLLNVRSALLHEILSFWRVD